MSLTRITQRVSPLQRTNRLAPGAVFESPRTPARVLSASTEDHEPSSPESPPLEFDAAMQTLHDVPVELVRRLFRAWETNTPRVDRLPVADEKRRQTSASDSGVRR